MNTIMGQLRNLYELRDHVRDLRHISATLGFSGIEATLANIEDTMTSNLDAIGPTLANRSRRK